MRTARTMRFRRSASATIGIGCYGFVTFLFFRPQPARHTSAHPGSVRDSDRAQQEASPGGRHTRPLPGRWRGVQHLRTVGRGSRGCCSRSDRPRSPLPSLAGNTPASAPGCLLCACRSCASPSSATPPPWCWLSSRSNGIPSCAMRRFSGRISSTNRSINAAVSRHARFAPCRATRLSPGADRAPSRPCRGNLQPAHVATLPRLAGSAIRGAPRSTR